MQNDLTMILLFQQFVSALVAILANPNTPKLARTLFQEAATEFANRSKKGFDSDKESLADALLRAFGVKPMYAPEVEARRADYERLAESFAALAELHRHGTSSPLDCGDYEGRAISNAIDDHICAVQMQAEWFDPRTIKRFYVEMRLHADQMAIEYSKADAPKLEADRMALSVGHAFDNSQAKQDYFDYSKLFAKAAGGRIWTPERVRALYPTLKEISDELDEARRFAAEHDLARD